MLLHIVLLNFRDDVGEEHKQGIYAALEGLAGKVDGVLAVRHGPNVSPEGLSKGYRDGFVIEMRDAEARDRYLAHPDHEDVGRRIVAAATNGLEGILPFDLEV